MAALQLGGRTHKEDGERSCADTRDDFVPQDAPIDVDKHDDAAGADDEGDDLERRSISAKVKEKCYVVCIEI